MTTTCPLPRQVEKQAQKSVRETRFAISRNRGQASTKVRYIETSAMSPGCKLCE
ncbi:hypothetical protein [Shewanella sp. HN-41]|uniref:hypothetical protein n=1 Tax=Shewanella sp. HN-41 TaxID=327275 RepID=UPI0002125993|nr:hypothetical protein [Shewanella sp. HN-41]EGM68234.1 hypothetical protein SOHN41_03726 [Shewanella sp. HN-41]